ncbi:hypothetical protein [Paraconexibacter sp.]|uniref:hypothetical protein n=1 Tax=Paraconexibacter sp. TaxID=2949640 RepID=UPI003569244D
MPVRVVFTCDVCGVRPDEITHGLLQEQLQLLLCGEYLDSEPDGWLTWTGRGVYGAVRRACRDHRAELKAAIRKDYGTLGFHPWAEGPHPAGWHFREDAARARRRHALARRPGFAGGYQG